jgi:hypothetical protein
MDQNPPDPDNRLRGRPPGKTKKVMNVSLALDVYNAMMKVPDGKRSEFISDILRPVTNQFDPGPSSYLALSLKQLVDSAIYESKKENDYEKLAAVSSLANEVMPKLEPYVELCKGDSVQTTSEVVRDGGEIDEIIDKIRIARTLKRLESSLLNAEVIHNAVPLRYQDKEYEKILEKTKVLLAAASHMLARYIDYGTEEHVFQNVVVEKPKESGILTNFTSYVAEYDFRNDLPMEETVRNCHRVLEDADEISDKEIKKFIKDACSFVDSSVRRSWGSGIDIQLSSYSIHPENGTFLVNLYNRGQYSVSISNVRCDGDSVTFHASLELGEHLSAHEEAVVEVWPCVSFSKKPTHKATFEIGYIQFLFELAG